MLGTEASVTLEILRPMFKANKKALSLLTLANQIHAELQLPTFYPVDMIKATSDAGYAALESEAAILEGFGPRGAGYHGDDEHIVAASVEPRLYLVARLLIELGKQ